MKIQIIIFFLFSTFICNGQTDKVAIQFNDTTSLELVKAAFEPNNKKIDYFDGEFVVGIDGTILFGTDGELPRYILKEAVLRIADRNYDLDVRNMYNPWFGGINEQFFNIKKEGNQFQLTKIFSDGAGIYAAEWLIIGCSSIRTLITADEEKIIEFQKEW
ncbi:hypothetical protein LB467_18260 [Salegentibacter sp. JZCK2]|uniref:hypothetical protein n=1 Tax=Salegentibacter tibetensis TaxID=2873600 RepID=UPI001CCAC186|nr:hypothetical protein [Salegentibacter tibetensis]MBZ9731634.1 hypothetical protein [Salegentibacter tibetensis]